MGERAPARERGREAWAERVWEEPGRDIGYYWRGCWGWEEGLQLVALGLLWISCCVVMRPKLRFREVEFN